MSLYNSLYQNYTRLLYGWEVRSGNMWCSMWREFATEGSRALYRLSLTHPRRMNASSRWLSTEVAKPRNPRHKVAQWAQPTCRWPWLRRILSACIDWAHLTIWTCSLMDKRLAIVTPSILTRWVSRHCGGLTNLKFATAVSEDNLNAFSLI